MSAWTDFRNSIESLFSPAIQEAINFAHALENDVEGAESAAIQAGFTAATIAYSAATGTLEQKAIAALEALGTSLLGSVVVVVKQAASETASIPNVSPAGITS